jgi:hypothetical protein
MSFSQREKTKLPTISKMRKDEHVKKVLSHSKPKTSTKKKLTIESPDN